MATKQDSGVPEQPDRTSSSDLFPGPQYLISGDEEQNKTDTTVKRVIASAVFVQSCPDPNYPNTLTASVHPELTCN